MSTEQGLIKTWVCYSVSLPKHCFDFFCCQVKLLCLLHSILHTAFKWQCVRDNSEISFHTMYMYRLVYSYILLVRRDGKFFFFFFLSLLKKQGKMILVFSRVWDKERILSPHKELNLRPSDSLLRSFTNKLKRFYGEQGPLCSLYMTLILHTARISSVVSE